MLTHQVESQDLNEGTIPVEIHAAQDLTSGTPSSVRPFFYDILPVGTEVEA